MTLGSALRVVHTDKLVGLDLALAHIGSILIGISCVVFMAAPTALSAGSITILRTENSSFFFEKFNKNEAKKFLERNCHSEGTF